MNHMPSDTVTRLIRETGVSDVACDIPPGMTVGQYRAARRPRKTRSRLLGRRRHRL
jgi:hypothetical protein